MILSFFSCGKEEFEISNLNGNSITLLGHGGMGIHSTYPMNSYESISKCLNLGMDGTEIDIQLTKDGTLVAFHDEDLSQSTSLSGTIFDFTWDELKNVDYQYGPYGNYRILKLNDIFSSMSKLTNYTFFLECKLTYFGEDAICYYELFAERLIEFIERYNLENNVYIEAKEQWFIITLKEKRPNYKIFIYTFTTFQNGFELANKYNLKGITISSKIAKKTDIDFAHANGIMVSLFDLRNRKDNIEAINKSPDFLETDDVEGILKLLR